MKTTNSKNLNLLTECKEGNRDAQHQLYEMYRVKLFTLCLRYMKKREDAEDIFQEAWVKVFNNLDQFDEQKGSFYGWIRRIFVNSCLEYFRKKKIYLTDLDDSITMPTVDAEDAISAMTMQEMLGILQTLPDGYRTVFNLYVIEGYAHKEIAEMLNVSVSTSKTQLMKAKGMLREKVSLAFAV